MSDIVHQSTQARKNPSALPIHTALETISCACVPLPLGDDHGLEVLALGHLGLDVGDDVGEIWGVLHCISKRPSVFL
jgi:hypothetical protein